MELKYEQEEKSDFGPLPPAQITPPVAEAQDSQLSAADEHTWAMLAHLSVLLNVLVAFSGVGLPVFASGLAGCAVALLIYFAYNKRSDYVAYQAMQAFLFQAILWPCAIAGIGVMWAFVGTLSLVLVGILLIPIAIILTLILICGPVVTVIYGIIGAIRASNGEDFHYWLVGDWARKLI